MKDSNHQDAKFIHNPAVVGALAHEATAYGLIFTDLDCRIIYWNKGAAAIFGYSQDEVLGKDISLIFTPEDIAIHVDRKEIQRAAEVGVADDERWHRTKDGSRFWASGVMTSLKDPSGNLIGYSKILRDQTSRKRTVDRMRAHLNDLSHFAHSASHDLSEPLRTLSLYLEVLDGKCRGKLGRDVDQSFDVTAKAVHRLRELLDSLLLYVHTDGHDTVHSVMDTSAVFDMAVSNLRALIDENGAFVTRSSLPIISAVPGQVLQVFQNLIANAIKFRSGAAPRIAADVTGDINEWVFSLNDNGQGIPADKQERIFDPFARLHRQDEVPGSGLGLSICKRIIEAHRGRIWVESSPGAGTTVYFTLPR